MVSNGSTNIARSVVATELSAGVSVDASAVSTRQDDLLPGHVVDGDCGWFPVVSEARLDAEPGRPVEFTLFGEQYVAWVGPDANPAATSRRCPHRRADLVDGRVDDATLVCPYHGWRFGADGGCALVPQLGPDRPVPQNAHLTSLPARRRWGMMWVWGSSDVEPAPMPTWTDVDGAPGGDGFAVFLDTVETWEASALRVVDNLLDTVHPAFVHVGTFGDPDRPDVEADTVEATPAGLRTVVTERSAAEQTAADDLRLTETELVGPFSVRTRAFTGPNGSAGPGDFALWTVAVPIDDVTTSYVRFQATDRRLSRDPDTLRAFSRRVLEEDRPIVEGLEQPLALRPGAEIHLRTDRPTIMYRRYLAANQRGAAWPPTG